MTQETPGRSDLMRSGAWLLYLSRPTLPDEAQWEEAVGMLTAEEDRRTDVQDRHREHQWGCWGNLHLAVLALTLTPPGSCFYPGQPRITSEIIIC